MIFGEIEGIGLKLNTHPQVFSPSGIDPGTLAMLRVAQIGPGDKVLDLGCGYGVVGIYAALRIGAENVVLSDSDARAVRLAQENAGLNGVPGLKVVKSDGFLEIEDTGFSKILSNPPYHANFEVPRRFIEKGFNRLVLGGAMYMVTKRRLWYQNKLTAIFGGVRVVEADGYFVFEAQKRDMRYANVRGKEKKAARQ